MAPKIPTTIACSSLNLLDFELGLVRDGLGLEETEDSWDKITQAILRLSALANGSATNFSSQLVAAVKGLVRPISNALNSDRSRLSGAATDLVAELAASLQRPSFETLIPLFVPTLLSLATRSMKIFVTRAKACLLSIVENVQSPAILPFLRVAVTDKSASLRLVATDLVVTCLNCYNPPDIEVPARAEDIEAVIRTTARDASADVRRSSRKVFEAYKILLPARIDSFVAPLTPTMRKYLDIKAKSKSAAAATTSSHHRPLLLSASLSASSHDTARPKVHASSSRAEKEKDARDRAHNRQQTVDMPPPPPPTRGPSSGPVRPPLSMRHTVGLGAPARPFSVHLPHPMVPPHGSSAFDISKSQPTSRGGAQRPLKALAPAHLVNEELPKSADLDLPGRSANTKFDITKSMRSVPVSASSDSDLKGATGGPRRVPKAPVPASVSVAVQKRDHENKGREKASASAAEAQLKKVKGKDNEKALLSSSYSSSSKPVNETRSRPPSRSEAPQRPTAVPASSLSPSTTKVEKEARFRPASRREAGTRAQYLKAAAEEQPQPQQRRAKEGKVEQGIKEAKDGHSKRVPREREPSQQRQQQTTEQRSSSRAAAKLQSAPAPASVPQESDASTQSHMRTLVSASEVESILPPTPLSQSTRAIQSTVSINKPMSTTQDSSVPSHTSTLSMSRARSGLHAPTLSQLAKKDAVKALESEQTRVQASEGGRQTVRPLVISKPSKAPTRRSSSDTMQMGKEPVERNPDNLTEAQIDSYSNKRVASEAETNTETEDESDEESACLIAADVPLPQSPASNRTFTVPDLQFTTPTPLRASIASNASKYHVAATPISALLLSIQHGFDFSMIDGESECEYESEADMDTTLSLPHSRAQPRAALDVGMEVSGDSRDNSEMDCANNFVNSRTRKAKAGGGVEGECDNRMPLALRELLNV